MNGHESSIDSSNGLPGTKVGREERIVEQMKSRCVIYFQNGLVPKLLQKEERHSKRWSHLQVRWKVKGKDL